MKSICFFYNNIEFGGAEKIISEICFASKNEVETKLVTCNIENYKLLEPYDPTRITNFNLLGSSRLPMILLRYYNYLKTNRPDLSVSFLLGCNMLNIIASRLTHTKTIVSYRGSVTPFLQNPLKHLGLYLYVKMDLFLSRKADAVIVNSLDNAKELVDICGFIPSKIHCIYNPKDIELIRKKMYEPLDNPFFQTDELIIITAGRLSPEKGQRHLIRIFAELQKNIPCRLVICGTGNIENELKALVSKLKLNSKVLFTGFQENIWKYIHNSSVFVLSSYVEGLPNALIEALICGCPIVSSNCKTGPREILDDGRYGLLSPDLSMDIIEDNLTSPLTQSEKEMYNCIYLLLTNPELRKYYSDLSIERLNLFDKKKNIDKYYKLFLDTINSNTR